MFAFHYHGAPTLNHLDLLQRASLLVVLYDIWSLFALSSLLIKASGKYF